MYNIVAYNSHRTKYIIILHNVHIFNVIYCSLILMPVQHPRSIRHGLEGYGTKHMFCQREFRPQPHPDNPPLGEEQHNSGDRLSLCFGPHSSPTPPINPFRNLWQKLVCEFFLAPGREILQKIWWDFWTQHIELDIFEPLWPPSKKFQKL